MQALTIIIAGPDRDRFRAGLAIAAAQAALGGAVTVYCHEGAVALLKLGEDVGDTDRQAHGLPTRTELIATVLDLGVRLVACQTGLAIHGLTVGELPPGTIAGGLVSLLAETQEHRLLVA